jgi:hypothetical protein
VAAFPTVDWDAASRVLDPKSVSGDRRLAPSDVIVLATLVLVARTRGGA